MFYIDFKKLVRWAPIAMAGVVAVVQAINEQKEEDRINDMDARIEKLENGGEA